MKQIIKYLIVVAALTAVVFGGSKKIVVDLTKQEAYAYENGKLVYSGWISSGRAEFKTRTGRFRVLQKEKEHISNEWPKKEIKLKNGKKRVEVGGAKMPFMMRLTWSGIALHEGYTPNYPASHGCIRVAKGFAKKLYMWASVGTRVVVKGKAPKRVARSNKKFRYYYASKKSKGAKRLSKSSKWVNYYAKLSYKKLNKILRKKYRQKKYLLATKKYSYKKKVQKLKKIKWLVKIIKEAKHQKYLSKKSSLKKLAKAYRYRRLGLNKSSYPYQSQKLLINSRNWHLN
ncbi:MAG TPA: hypothetical protein ENK74_06865 [Nitratifractor sp.]|nr:hypothetical protein [Nitratifractor sp.]